MKIERQKKRKYRNRWISKRFVLKVIEGRKTEEQERKKLERET